MRSHKVLVVEDEAMVMMLIEDFLEELGHQVVARASRVGEAEELARSGDIDLAVLDLNIAGESCAPIAVILKSRGIPFIFASGYGSAAGLGDFADVILVGKPFELESFASAVSRAVGG
jgi:DNA-binding response OmpR family regulator